MQSRTCPKCKKIIPIDHEFHFDDNFNLIHDECGSVVFAADTFAEHQISVNYSPPLGFGPHVSHSLKMNKVD